MLECFSVALEGIQSSGRSRNKTCYMWLPFVQRTLSDLLLEVLLERPFQGTECTIVVSVSATYDICSITDSTL